MVFDDCEWCFCWVEYYDVFVVWCECDEFVVEIFGVWMIVCGDD